jgi:uncharacterized membrane protein YkvA (DUF1232 family)
MPELDHKKKPKKALGFAVIVVSIIYMLNPTAGLFELLPDNIPVIGHVDEILAIGLILSSIRYIRTGVFKLPTR